MSRTEPSDDAIRAQVLAGEAKLLARDAAKLLAAVQRTHTEADAVGRPKAPVRRASRRPCAGMASRSPKAERGDRREAGIGRTLVEELPLSLDAEHWLEQHVRWTCCAFIPAPVLRDRGKELVDTGSLGKNVRQNATS